MAFGEILQKQSGSLFDTVQPVHLVRTQFEIKDLGVFVDSVRIDRLRNDKNSFLKKMAKENLGR